MDDFVSELKNTGQRVDYVDDKEQLFWLLSHPDFEFYPVDIVTFIDSDKYLGAKTCRRSVKKVLIELFGDRQYVEENPKKIFKYEELVEKCGIGSGKTFTGSIIILYAVYRLLCLKSPQGYYNRSSRSLMACMLMSTSEKHAKDVIFGEINARIQENQHGIFKKEFQSNHDITTQLNFPKKVSIIPGNSSETFFTGYNIFAAVIDECDDHKKTDQKDYVQDGYEAIHRRVTSRFLGYGFIGMLGSPRTVNGFMTRMYNKAITSEHMLGVYMPTWEAIDKEEFSGQQFEATDPLGKIHLIPIEYRRDILDNPEHFWRDLGAIPSYAIEPFITLPTKIESCVANHLVAWDGNGVFPQVKGSGRKEYVAHVDLGINKSGGDHCGIAVGRVIGTKEIEEYGQGVVKRPIIEISFMARLSAVSGQEIQISDVRRYLLALRENGFVFDVIQFDSWNSKDSIQILQKLGIRTQQVSVDKDSFAYEALKEAIYNERIMWGDLWVKDAKSNVSRQILHEELKQLQRVKGSKVDHPVGGSKDLADAVAGVVIGLTDNKKLHNIDNKFTPLFLKDNLSIENIQNEQNQQKRRVFSYINPTKKVAGFAPEIVR